MRKLEKSQQLCQSLFQGDFLNAIGDQNTRLVRNSNRKSVSNLQMLETIFIRSNLIQYENTI